MARSSLPKNRFRPGHENLGQVGEAARLWNTGKLTRIPQHILGQRIPRLAAGVSPDELPLLPRTHNCLKNAGLLNSLRSLEGLTIQQLLEVRHFGPRSLSDLIFALSPLVCQRATEATRTGRDTLIKEARKLRDTKGAELVYRDDPRFKSILRNIDHRARDARHAAERIISGEHSPGDATSLTKLIRQLRGRIKHASKMKLEDELWDLASNKKERKRRIAIRRFGWDGMEPATLQEAGDLFGVTREYVRVICKTVLESFQVRRVFAPALDGVLKFVADCADQSEAQIERELLRRRLVKGHFSLYSVLSAAEILGRDTALLQSLAGSDAWMQSAHERLRRRIFLVCRNALRRWGMSRLDVVQTQLRQQRGIEIDSDALVQLLREIPEFCWLDAKTGWFCLKAENTVAALRIKRALAVARRLPLSDLRAITRHRYRAKSLEIPDHVLVEFCRQLPSCRVEGDYAIADRALRWNDVLPESERIIVQLFKEHGPVLSWTRLIELARTRGIAAVESIVSYSLVTRKHGLGAWSLLGAHVSARQVQRVQAEMRPRSKIFARSLETETEGKSRIKAQLLEV